LLLYAIFFKTGVFSQFMCAVVKDLMECNGHGFALGVAHNPVIVVVFDDVRGVHPVEWLVCAAVGMNSNTSIGLHHDESQRFGKARLETAGIFNSATRYEKSHVSSLADEVLGDERIS
jgi:hypothetical protein